MTVIIDYTTGFPLEIPCPGCGWPMYCCLCEADDLKEDEMPTQVDMSTIDKLVLWLKNQIKTENELGNETRAQELELEDDYPKVVSPGHYQRSVAYQKCLAEVKRLNLENPPNKSLVAELLPPE